MLHVSGIVANVMIVNLQTFLVTEDTVVRLQNNFINSYVFGWSMFPSVLMEVCFPVFWWKYVSHCFGWSMFPTVLMNVCFPLFWWKYVSHCFGWSMFPTVLVEVCFPLFWWKYVSHCFDGWPIFTLAESHDWLSLCYLLYRKHWYVISVWRNVT